jgi:hypothetical protein
VALGPAQVHPEQHLGPVGGLGAAGSGADREDRGAVVVLAREQQLRPLALEVGLERAGLPFQLRRQLRIRRLLDQLERGEQVGDPALEAAPPLDLLAEAVGLAERLLRRALVVPESRLGRQRLEVGDPSLPGVEVKDAPTSTGSARPGP